MGITAILCSAINPWIFCLTDFIAIVCAVNTPLNPDEAAALLQWYADMGVDDAVNAEPLGLYNWKPPSPSTPAPPEYAKAPLAKNNSSDRKATGSTPGADEAAALAKKIAATCNSFEALKAAIEEFDGCPLKTGARNTVFADGVPGAELLVIGEAPGAEEDRVGKPFVGRAGQLLDRMLAAIGRSRNKNVLISNVIYWRPPANRTPTSTETAICRPFVERLIELTDPKAVMLAGGAPMQALLGITGIMRARGVWRELILENGAHYQALPIFHPAFLLRQPKNKRLAWADLQSLEARLSKD